MTDSLEIQRAAWNKWNEAREGELHPIPADQRGVILSWFAALGRNDLKILEVGCGAGWLCDHLTAFGEVTAIDLADEHIAKAAVRLPHVNFIAGDFMQQDVGRAFDVVVCLEVLSHVADQAAFMSRIAGLLKPVGYLMLATQNRSALEMSDLPRIPGQLRRWVNRRELTMLLMPAFRVERMFSITPHFNRGPLRILNSERLRRTADVAKLGSLLRVVKRIEEKVGLGWTIMTLAQAK
jgi:2-polyprenyl-3-methyl-5-hydroxy-6-metoxy-1,4-benzoquinol methylase